jgi:hypothetical protein
MTLHSRVYEAITSFIYPMRNVNIQARVILAVMTDIHQVFYLFHCNTALNIQMIKINNFYHFKTIQICKKGDPSNHNKITDSG